ncbi:MAG: Sec-independent protein translocase protein TatC [Acidimicrobiales bacterium]|nr:MAG: Sec-independent protein translocase protein TatC [Acidimicrobiales bacterium]
MTLLEHLAELRTRLIRSLLAIAVGGVVCWLLYPRVLSDVLLEPLCTVRPDSCRLVITDPTQGLSARLWVASYGGVALAMPVILWQTWRFVTPGLYPNERRIAVGFLTSAIVLFAAGAVLAYLTLPRALDFLIGVGGPVEAFFTPDSYIKLVVFLMIAFGVGFEFPVLLVFLQMVDVLQADTLRSWRRQAMVLIVAVVAFITPSGDPYTLLALSIPMYAFYEGSILFGVLRDRRRRRGGRK